MITFTPGSSFPDSIRHSECGLPLSTRDTLSFRSALRSTYTVDGSGLEAPYKKINNDQKLCITGYKMYIYNNKAEILNTCL